MQRRTLMPTIGLLLLFTFSWGCSGFAVSDSSKKSLNGVPIYTKVGKWKQVTTYNRTWLEVTFTLSEVNAEGKKTNARSRVLRFAEKSWTQAAFDDGLEEAVTAAGNGEKLAAVSSAFVSGSALSKLTLVEIATDAAISTDSPTFLAEHEVANAVDLVTEVDYGAIHYYNVKVPIFGSAEASIKLAGDGSLSEASTKIDATGIAAEIPLAEVLSKELSVEDLAAAIKKDIVLDVQVRQRGYAYALVAYSKYSSGLPTAPLTFAGVTLITRTELGSANKSSKKPGKTVSFSGSVELPKQASQ